MYSNIFPFQSFASLLLKKTIPGGWVVGWVVVLNENITTSAPIEPGLGLSLAKIVYLWRSFSLAKKLLMGCFRGPLNYILDVKFKYRL